MEEKQFGVGTQENSSNKKKNESVVLIIGIILLIIIIGAYCFFQDNTDNEMKYIEKNWGETFTLEGIDITIKSYEFRYYILNNSFKAPSGKVWLVINATLYNDTANTISLSEITDSIFYIDNDTAVNYNSTFSYYNDWINAHDEIVPYERITGIFTYAIPENIVPSPQGNKTYANGGTFSGSSTQNINFELRIKKNKINTTECYVIKL